MSTTAAEALEAKAPSAKVSAGMFSWDKPKAGTQGSRSATGGGKKMCALKPDLAVRCTQKKIYLFIYTYPPTLGWRVTLGRFNLPLSPPNTLKLGGGPRQAPKRGTLSHLAYWNLLHKILDVAA